MSISSLHTRHLSARSSNVMNMFSLSGLPLILLLGLFIALTGCTAPTSAFPAPGVTTSASTIAGATEGNVASHTITSAGGALG